jgi:glycosyltransferase involved in cell wall biosynthesis
MRIGIDCRYALDPERGEGAGIGHYIDSLVRSLVRIGGGHTFVLFFDKHARPSLRKDLARLPNVEVRTFPFHAIFSRIPLLQSHVVVSGLFARSNLDLLHGPANTIPVFYRGRSVITIHDLAVYDHPEWFPSPFPGAGSFSRRMVVPYSIEHAARIIAVSETTANDIVRLFGRNRADIDVAYGGVDGDTHPEGMEYPDDDMILAKMGVRQSPYVLSVATIEPRKNLARAVRAFSAFVRASAPRHNGLRYVIAGKRGWKHAETVSAITEENARIRKETGIDGAIAEIGYVSAAEKRTLYAHAETLLFPSLHEGFGLPMIEAMAAGTPVITGNTGAMPEVAGTAAILVDPTDESQIARALADVLDHPERRALLAAGGRARAVGFTWVRTAERTLVAYERAMGKT